MPKPRHSIDEFCLQRLKEEVQLKLGIQVNNRPACELLSTNLRSVYGISISASTISRLFLNTKKDNHFYLDTLDKLCNLVQNGSNWNKYCEAVLTQREHALSIGIHHEIDFRTSLLYINFEFSGWKVLRTYFERLQPFLDKPSFQYLSFDLGGALHRIACSNVSFEKSLYKNFVGFEAVRKSFFELLADPEFKLPNYKEGLVCYGKAIDYNHPTSANDLCFYLSMLCLNDDKINELNSFLEHYSMLIYNFNLQNLVNLNVHPFNIGRFLAVLLIYSNRFKTRSYENCFSDLILFSKRNINNWTAYEKRLIQYFFVYGLFRSNAPDKSYKVVEKLFVFNFFDGRDLKGSVSRFLYDKEPNTIAWYRRWGTLQT